jgi:hypothetical protein
MEPVRSVDDSDRPAINFAALKLDGLTTNLEYAARKAQIERARETCDAQGTREQPIFDATPYHKARNALGRAR